MTKLLAIMGKNFKLVLRSKTSAVIMLLGPVVLMLAIGLALNNTNTERINVGYHVSSASNLTDAFIGSITREQYSLLEYETIKDCRDAIGTGNAHICIVFPPDFEISNDKVNQIDFFVDNSKVNFFQSVVDSIENDFNSKALEYTRGLTQEILSKLNETSEEITDNSQVIALLKAENTEIAAELAKTQEDVRSMNLAFDINSLKINDIAEFGRVIENLQNHADDAADEAEDLMDDVEEFAEGLTNITSAEQNELAAIINASRNNIVQIRSSINSTAAQSSSNFDATVSNLKKNLQTLDSTLEKATASQSGAIAKIDSLKLKTSQAMQKIGIVDKTFNAITSNIASTEITSIDTIIKPIEKNIKPVVAEKSQLDFYFPYLIVLVVMFIGILISSSLVNLEKGSKAYFRNFVTPTTDLSFIMGTFLTTMIFIGVQILFVYLVFTYYFGNNVMDSLREVSIILILTAAIFAFIGMLIGNIFATQESSMLASICLSSIMLFLSDLVFPLEKMPEYVAKYATSYNPFYVSSDLLRKSMVHKVSIVFMDQQIALLLLSALLLFLCVWLTHKMVKKHVLMRFSGYMARRDIRSKMQREDYMKVYMKMKQVSANNHFMTNDKKELANMVELISYIGSLDDKVFAEYVDKDKNMFADWVSKSLGNEPLAALMYKETSRRGTIRLLKTEEKRFEKFDKEQTDEKKK